MLSSFWKVTSEVSVSTHDGGLGTLHEEPSNSAVSSGKSGQPQPPWQERRPSHAAQELPQQQPAWQERQPSHAAQEPPQPPPPPPAQSPWRYEQQQQQQQQQREPSPQHTPRQQPLHSSQMNYYAQQSTPPPAAPQRVETQLPQHFPAPMCPPPPPPPAAHLQAAATDYSMFSPDAHREQGSPGFLEQAPLMEDPQTLDPPVVSRNREELGPWCGIFPDTSGFCRSDEGKKRGNCVRCKQALRSYFDHSCPKCPASVCITCLDDLRMILLTSYRCQGCGDQEANRQVLQNSIWMVNAYRSANRAFGGIFGGVFSGQDSSSSSTTRRASRSYRQQPEASTASAYAAGATAEGYSPPPAPPPVDSDMPDHRTRLPLTWENAVPSSAGGRQGRQSQGLPAAPPQASGNRLQPPTAQNRAPQPALDARRQQPAQRQHMPPPPPPPQAECAFSTRLPGDV
eukprot:TRINITY_DN704_c0_g1_i1.p1 TRINITY_DN704_c0_g1~~TRINITY_DN704_c0_g1_i1.p1  ORF type:complete len:524 (+),score=97.59 TRINITY_DN704_c0_g1_i1:208-1572(+)